MAFQLADRIRETSTTTGTGSYALNGAVTGFQTFAGAIGNNQTVYFVTMGSQWEVGIGTLSGSSLARTTILASTNGGAAVNWGAGTKEIRCDVPAAILMQIYQGSPRWAGTLGGTATALTATLSPPIHSYWAGLTILGLTPVFLSNVAVTLNVNGLGAASIRRWNNQNIDTNIIGSNALLMFVYDGTLFRIVQHLHV